ncbi:MAG: ribonuclease E inhibitor RraB [Bryobacterales bacterium]|nr:ribonuclease E inhibitor RraB [Bryobacterales bacterium]
MTDNAIAKAVRKHQLRNDTLVQEFERRSVNLNEPRIIDFHFCAWNQRDAAVVARSLYEIGFLVKLLAPAPTESDPKLWAIEAGAKIPLVQATGSELTEKLVRIAINEDATFDGWGTSV